MPDRFIFGYEIPIECNVTLNEVMDAIRQGKLHPYHPQTEKRLQAPYVKKRIRRFSQDEIMSACMKANGERRNRGLGPLVPMTQEYQAFLKQCWHTEDDYSWKHLEDSQTDKVKQWCFLVAELEDLFKFPWVTGNELLQPPWNLTKDTLFDHVVAGRLVPYEPFQRVVHPEEEPFGARRVMPNEDLQKLNTELIRKQIDAGQLRDRLAKTDEELMVGATYEIQEPEEPVDFPRLLKERREKWQSRLEELEQEIGERENDLHPTRVWKVLNLTPADQGEILDKLKKARYQRAEVRLVVGNNDKEKSSTTLPFPCEPGTRWEDVTFILKSDELVYVKTPMGDGRMRFDQLGFVDKRKGDAPNISTWPLFTVFARLEGKISIQSPYYDRRTPDKARLLNRHLKRLFGINDSIYTEHYRKFKRYKVRFHIRDERII